MKAFQKNFLYAALMVFSAIVFSSVSAQADGIISIQAPASPVSVGSFFDVSVDITDATDLYAYQFDISFNPSVLFAQSITEGPFLLSGGATFFIPGTIDNSGGLITFTANSLLGEPSGVSGNGSLATIQFLALAGGTSLVDLSNIILLDSSGADISFSSNSGSVTVTYENPVPIPGAVWLLGSGLLGLIGLKRKFLG